MAVPDVEVTAGRELRHRLSVGAPDREQDAPPVLLSEAAVPPGNCEARHQPLDVLFPRARQRLIKVVHVEDEAAFGRPEGAEVCQVGVTTALGPIPVLFALDRSDAIIRAAPL